MPGLLDDVMDGIAAKEKQTPPATPPAAPPQAPPAQTPPPAPEGKALNEYSDDFKKKYGERKKPA